MYKIKIEQFEGPLDLLLQLIEREELDITKVSLAQVTEQYLKYLKQVEILYPEELADFLVVAAKLLLIKSKVLLPMLELEEDEAILEKQLKLYKEFYEASKKINKILLKKKFSFSRQESKDQLLEPIFTPPENITPSNLRDLFADVIGKIEPIIKLPKEIIEKTISIQEKIKHIQEMILHQSCLNFKNLLNGTKSKTEVIVTFLALLELVKQKAVAVTQDNIFDDIKIVNHDRSEAREDPSAGSG